MKRHLWLSVFVALPLYVQAADPTSSVAWKKTVVDRKFRSEGVAVADVNNDGKLDILVGDVWYEAPDWKMHEIRKVGDYGDGNTFGLAGLHAAVHDNSDRRQHRTWYDGHRQSRR